MAKVTLIDMIAHTAKQLGAEDEPYSLIELYSAYREYFPLDVRGSTRPGFNAELCFHCINMPTRLSAPANQWLKRPLFKRVARGQYMLLSPAKIAQFNRYVAENNPLVYQSEYNVDDVFNHPLSGNGACLEDCLPNTIGTIRDLARHLEELNHKITVREPAYPGEMVREYCSVCNGKFTMSQPDPDRRGYYNQVIIEECLLSQCQSPRIATIIFPLDGTVPG